MDLSIAAHLDWISKNPKFLPQGLTCIGQTYLDVMKELYTHHKKYLTPAIVDGMRRNDEAFQKQITDYAKSSSVPDKYSFFVTIGFNHQTWSILKCVEVICRILAFDWIVSCRAIFEIHRENGEHPHVHFLLTTDGIKHRSKVIEKLWATRDIKKVVLRKSFIDVKTAADYHKKYIMLDKIPEKLVYVERDKIWRLENSIPEFFIK